ncbi:MAG: relaxase domain-containing protein [Gammaproteobacteria bacterium]|nr:relaxase domain-containing protein [Gammaproteobacteria bacterium]MBU1654577.1 relaxase domain-containing protein [Gammaproteobacteria bacterium]MBU1961969.1 relaxase domain-containing protein [Gammaproteobacteria bacterium]
MMSISGMAGAAAASYFSLVENEKGTKSRGPDEYYSQGGDSPGTWHGEGAKALELSGTVKGEQFRRIAAGYRPDTGEPGVQNAGSGDRRAGWDLTLSAPKSVSVAMAVANENDRESIIAAHRQAVDAAMCYVEREAAFTRRGHAGATQETAGLVISRFAHQTSREGDPQLHSHNFVHNLAVRADGST